MKLRTCYFVAGFCCLVLVACGSGWGQPAVPPFDSPEAAGLNPLNFVNIDVLPGVQASGGGGTRDVGWDSIGFDPGTGDAEFVYFAFLGGTDSPWCVPRRKVVSRAGVVHSQDGYLTDQGNEWMNAYVNSVIGLDPGFDPGTFFGGLQGDDITGDYIFNTIAGDLDTPSGLAGGWKGFVENTLGGGNTLTGAGYYPNQGDDVCVFQRLDRDGGLVTPLTAGRNIPDGNINAGVDITSGSAWTNVNTDIRIGGCAILSDGNSFFNVGDRSNKGTITFLGPSVPGNTTYGTIATPAGAFVNTTTATHPINNVANPDGAVVSAGNGYIVNGCINTTVMLNDMTSIFSADTNAVYDGSDLSLFPPSDSGGIGAGFSCDDDETIPEAGPDTIYVPGRYTNAAGDTVIAIARYAVDVGAQTVTPLPILTPMDDLAPAPVGTPDNGRTTNLDTNEDGDLAVVYRNPDDNTVICRIYNSDGTTRVGSFYVSANGANDNLEELYTVFDPANQNFAFVDLGGATEIPLAGSTIGGNAGKAAHCQVGFTKNGAGDDVIGVMWLTTSTVASANTTDVLCNGANKSLPAAHAARLISLSPPPPPSSAVENWDLLN